MGSRGPKRTPAALLKLRGSELAHQREATEPKPGADQVERPSWLSGVARQEWDKVAPELLRLGLLTNVDLPALAGYCAAYGHAVDCEKILKKEGRTFTAPSGYPQQRPEVAMARSAWETVRKFAAEFGLTPGARGRIEIEPPAKEEDPLEAFLRRGREARAQPFPAPVTRPDAGQAIEQDADEEDEEEGEAEPEIDSAKPGMSGPRETLDQFLARGRRAPA